MLETGAIAGSTRILGCTTMHGTKDRRAEKCDPCKPGIVRKLGSSRKQRRTHLIVGLRAPMAAPRGRLET